MIGIFYDNICYNITLNYRCFGLFGPVASKNSKKCIRVNKIKMFVHYKGYEIYCS